MAIFSRAREAIRTFGQKLFGKSDDAARLRKEADVAKARADAAARQHAESAKLARELSSPRARAEAASHAGTQAEERRQSQASDAQRRARLAQEEQARAKARAAELRRKADEVERLAAQREATTAKAREAYLRTRQNVSPEEFEQMFQGPRPAAPKINKNKKEAGAGLLPDEKMFLYLRVPLSRFASSNVSAIVYDAQAQALYISYIKSGLWYKYGGVPVSVARLAYSAVSRGVFVWDAIRVRGTRQGHQYPATKNSPPPPPIEPNSAEGMVVTGGVGM